MRKGQRREERCLAQGHIAAKWQSVPKESPLFWFLERDLSIPPPTPQLEGTEVYCMSLRPLFFL